MTHIKEIFGSQGIDMSTYASMSGDNAGRLLEALMTPVDLRSPKQKREIFNAAWVSSKRRNRAKNVEVAHGVSIHTGNGKRTFLQKKRAI